MCASSSATGLVPRFVPRLDPRPAVRATDELVASGRESELSAPVIEAVGQCRWCDLAGASVTLADVAEAAERGDGVGALEGGEVVSYEVVSDKVGSNAFVVLPGAWALGGAVGLTIVPRRHVKALVELPERDMADVLAGLTRATVAVRKLSGADRVEVRAEMDGAAAGQDHVYFRVEPVVALAADAADDRSGTGGGCDLSRKPSRGACSGGRTDMVALPNKS